MSHSSHKDRYITKLLVGFASLTSAVFSIFYAIFESAETGDWYFWAIVASFLLCCGIYFSLSAFVHKIKADFARRKKAREEEKAIGGES